MITVIGMGSAKGDITARGTEAINRASLIFAEDRASFIGAYLAENNKKAVFLKETITDSEHFSEKVKDYFNNINAAAVYCAFGSGYEDPIACILIKNFGAEIIPGLSRAADMMSVPGISGGSYAVFSAKKFLERKINQFELNLPFCVYGIEKSGFQAVKEKLSDILGPSAKVYAATDGGIKETLLIELKDAETVCVKGADFTLRERQTFGDLLEVIRRLRDPDGCPWDRAQTHLSIRGNAVEEAYELVEALELNDIGKMIEESGDVMLQALFHSTIAEDNGEFSTNDMVSAISRKLIERHTHIFGENRANNAEEALGFWEKAKAKEKGQKGVQDKIDSVPATFSALMRAYKIQKIIKKTGFEFASVDGAYEKLYEEIGELREAPAEKLESEGGDLLFAAVNVLRMLGIDPEIALNRTVKKFIKRFAYIEKKAAEEGKAPEDFTLDQMEEWYQEYKRLYENR